ncbi:MAG: aspartate aminotransferase family protein [Actinomycetota bacterium]|nr:aspartate aminotransferase family protein [Actinomycetota bacterium]
MSNSGDELLDYFYPYRSRYPVFDRLPDSGVDKGEVLRYIEDMAGSEDALGDEGRCSGSIYLGDHDHYKFLSEVFSHFAHANVLQRDMYPSATKFEGEIISMVAKMLGGDSRNGEVCGVLTSGGSESLMSALYAYREWARKERGIEDPEVIIPVTAHVALDKGAHYFGIKVLHAPVTDEYLVDVDWVSNHINANTIAIVGSAGSYPYGLVDPIEELGKLALEHGIGLHVDGCLGGFLLPFAALSGWKVRPFDFSVPGVTSISVDTHKYGYALKGTSVLLYASRQLRKNQYFTYPDWPGGLYLSPGMAGSRSGGLIASTWASMVTMGSAGYRKIANDIMVTADKLKEAILDIDDLFIFGDPLFLVAFGSKTLDIFHVNDYLSQKGWRMNGLQLPAGLHFCITRPNTAEGVIEKFIEDLRLAVEYAKRDDIGGAKSGALYGIAGSPEGNAAVDELLSGALDGFLDVAPQV